MRLFTEEVRAQQKALLLTTFSRFSLPCLVGIILFYLVDSALAETLDLSRLVFDAVPLDATAITNNAGAPTYSQPVFKERFTLPNKQPRSLNDLLSTASKTQVHADYQSGLDSAPTLEATLHQQELRTGVFDLSLVEALVDLADAYEKSGNPKKAVSLYERASQIVRSNKGIYSLDLVPILQRKATLYLALDNLEAANVEQYSLYYLLTKSYDKNSADFFPVMQAFAQWNLATFVPKSFEHLKGVRERTINPLRGNLISYLDKTQPEMVFLKRNVDIYNHVIQTLSSKKPGDLALLSQAYLELAKAAFQYTVVYTKTFSITGDVSNENYTAETNTWHLIRREGYEALKTRVDLLKNHKASILEVTQAKLDLADWLVSSHGFFLDILENSYKDLVASGASAELVKGLFEPRDPLLLPNFFINANSRQLLGIASDTAIEYKGFVDVKIFIETSGRLRNYEILSESPNTPKELITQFKAMVSDLIFRPAVIEGKLAPRENIFIRYYYSW